MTYTPAQALRHLRALATTAVPNCVNLSAIDRVVGQTTFTEASTEEALLILDDALDAVRNWEPEDQDLGLAIEMAIQKLRPEPAPVHDAAALEQLALDHPIDLPWMREEQANAIRKQQGYPPIEQPAAGIVAMGVASDPPCSPLGCDGCGMCQEGGQGA